jgi:hypothetical protein
MADGGHMNPSRHVRISVVAACVASLAIAAPGDAFAAKHKRRAHKAAAIPVEVIPHKYLAGGDGATELTLPAGTPVNLFDPVGLAEGLGNQALGQLGLPPLPTLPLP